MNVTALRCVLVSAPYAIPGDAEREIHLKQGFRPASFIIVETDEGIDGVGETYAGVYAPEAVQALVAQLRTMRLGKIRVMSPRFGSAFALPVITGAVRV